MCTTPLAGKAAAAYKTSSHSGRTDDGDTAVFCGCRGSARTSQHIAGSYGLQLAAMSEVAAVHVGCFCSLACLIMSELNNVPITCQSGSVEQCPPTVHLLWV
jgi:hypothetical protein